MSVSHIQSDDLRPGSCPSCRAREAKMSRHAAALHHTAWPGKLADRSQSKTSVRGEATHSKGVRSGDSSMKRRYRFRLTALTARDVVGSDMNSDVQPVRIHTYTHTYTHRHVVRRAHYISIFMIERTCTAPTISNQQRRSAPRWVGIGPCSATDPGGASASHIGEYAYKGSSHGRGWQSLGEGQERGREEGQQGFELPRPLALVLCCAVLCCEPTNQQALRWSGCSTWQVLSAMRICICMSATVGMCVWLIMIRVV